MRAYDLQDPTYQPERLLRRAAVAVGASSVSNLAEQMGFAPAQVTRVIARRQRLTGDLIVALMDCTGWDLGRVRELAGLPQPGSVGA